MIQLLLYFIRKQMLQLSLNIYKLTTCSEVEQFPFFLQRNPTANRLSPEQLERDPVPRGGNTQSHDHVSTGLQCSKEGRRNKEVGEKIYRHCGLQTA